MTRRKILFFVLFSFFLETESTSSGQKELFKRTSKLDLVDKPKREIIKNSSWTNRALLVDRFKTDTSETEIQRRRLASLVISTQRATQFLSQLQKRRRLEVTYFGSGNRYHQHKSWGWQKRWPSEDGSTAGSYGERKEWLAGGHLSCTQPYYYQYNWDCIVKTSCGSSTYCSWGGDATNNRQCSTCAACGGGQYTSSGCVGGSSTANAACSNCIPGKFNEANAVNLRSCTVCPVGKYENDYGSNGCKDCPAGRWGNAAGTSSVAAGCVKCTAGKYQYGANSHGAGRLCR